MLDFTDLRAFSRIADLGSISRRGAGTPHAQIVGQSGRLFDWRRRSERC